jgi:hypothetical protein
MFIAKIAQSKSEGFIRASAPPRLLLAIFYSKNISKVSLSTSACWLDKTPTAAGGLFFFAPCASCRGLTTVSAPFWRNLLC